VYYHRSLIARELLSLLHRQPRGVGVKWRRKDYNQQYQIELLIKDEIRVIMEGTPTQADETFCINLPYGLRPVRWKDGYRFFAWKAG